MLRRELHRHPELKFEETRTARQVRSFLEALGIPVHGNIAKTGLVGTIYGQGRGPANPGRSIGLRADMDALPIHEATGLEYCSANRGKMHACGHDGHIVMLLGAAETLARRPDFDGTIHLIFQPGEEGGAGAQRMIEEGLFDLFPCEAVFALHNWPSLPVGKMGVRSGPIMAEAKAFEITIHGRGGHAALPHLSIDPIPIACAIVQQLQTLISRRVNPLDSAVLTVGKIEAGTSFNVIPDKAIIHGTCRTLGKTLSEDTVAGIQRVAQNVAAAHEAEASVHFHSGYPCTDNDPSAANFMGQVMAEVVGRENAVLDVQPALTAEDFSFMLQAVRGAYGFIGNASANGSAVPLHNPTYDFNDGNIVIGKRFWDLLARRWFQAKSLASSSTSDA
ncbi:M20 aminoacylase family protein [Caballeronia sp. GAFFF1]|uniref:M20 aminoacylase family protein n=1 Tax=Caballeronia sp. GAFFF1 TaxID=2921779 RepID=UPI002027982F|nr:M20 aminoacylase family protein [Caballeronia sp. GAFFF1]